MIEKLTFDGTMYVDPDGCSWESQSDWLMMRVLPSCGCGNPESIGWYVRDMLRQYVGQTGTKDRDCWDLVHYEELPVMFFLSWADDQGYTEHGSTIRCSWMTEKGDELLRDLDAVLQPAVSASPSTIRSASPP